MILFSHPTGNANVRHAASGLHRAGLLSELWICLAIDPEAAWLNLLPKGTAATLRRRALPAPLRKLTKTKPCREITRLFAHRLKLDSLVAHEKGWACIDAVYRSLDSAAAKRTKRLRKLKAVYAYEDGAATTFAAARSLGLHTLYDLPIGYWRAAREILTEEAELQPEWAMTLDGIRDSAEKTARKDAELALADTVFVASSYTRSTLKLAPGGSEKNVIVIPYGAPQGNLFQTHTKPRTGAPLRVLYVGSLGQRKGISYLFEAMQKLGSAATLTVIGSRPLVSCPALDRELAKHNWIPSCPNQEVLRQMAAHDVFVFPSLFEGFGLVLLEAMAQGLPIIATAHTAAPDIVTEGKDGFIIPIRSSDAIADRLQKLHDNPALLKEMSGAAIKTAARFTWEAYESQLAEAVSKTLASRTS